MSHNDAVHPRLVFPDFGQVVNGGSSNKEGDTSLMNRPFLGTCLPIPEFAAPAADQHTHRLEDDRSMGDQDGSSGSSMDAEGETDWEWLKEAAQEGVEEEKQKAVSDYIDHLKGRRPSSENIPKPNQGPIPRPLTQVEEEMEVWPPLHPFPTAQEVSNQIFTKDILLPIPSTTTCPLPTMQYTQTSHETRLLQHVQTLCLNPFSPTFQNPTWSPFLPIDSSDTSSFAICVPEPLRVQEKWWIANRRNETYTLYDHYWSSADPIAWMRILTRVECVGAVRWPWVVGLPYWWVEGEVEGFAFSGRRTE
ncbi:hypothetical protein HK097_006709 [Rhizophlyctis rosea]|uniref:Uncharacterized protein n=1 Tax=Rhizophlyctis rosea TaxID=64517 RepID=A0AAD5X2Q2_9FUNG|nr:hypothetical protein HK097_006709 [Rhizophlyctis rosea]